MIIKEKLDQQLEDNFKKHVKYEYLLYKQMPDLWLYVIIAL